MRAKTAHTQTSEFRCKRWLCGWADDATEVGQQSRRLLPCQDSKQFSSQINLLNFIYRSAIILNFPDIFPFSNIFRLIFLELRMAERKGFRRFVYFTNKLTLIFLSLCCSVFLLSSALSLCLSSTEISRIIFGRMEEEPVSPEKAKA